MSVPEPYDAQAWARNPHLMSVGDTALLVIDVQEKLAPSIRDRELVIWNIGRLIDGAGVLGVPVLASEQYPKGLGNTVAALASKVGDPAEKLSFSCAGCAPLVEDIRKRDVPKLLIAGIETHVCVQQTVLDLLADGYAVYIAVDAIGSRRAIDHETALRRMESAGAVLTTTEAALFEWCVQAGTPEFKEISRLVREPPPAETE